MKTELGCRAMVDPKLLKAYLNTIFVVDGPNGEVGLRVGESSQEIDNLLSAHGATECAFITAWNPRSARLQPQDNARRQRELVETVLQLHYRYSTGRGIGENKDWG